MPKAKIEPAQYSMRPMNGSVSIVRPLSFICSTFLSRLHFKYLSPGVVLLFILRPMQRWHKSHIPYSFAGPPHDGQDIAPPRDRDRSASALDKCRYAKRTKQYVHLSFRVAHSFWAVISLTLAWKLLSVYMLFEDNFEVIRWLENRSAAHGHRSKSAH